MSSNAGLLYNKENDAYTASNLMKRREYVKEEDDNMVSKTELKPPKGLSDKLKNEAARLPINDGKVMLDRKNPLHRMLMEESE